MEKWEDIKNFEGLYQISNLGRIKSLRRTVDTTKYKKIVEEKEMKQFIGTNGYMITTLSKNGKKYPIMVHRLVAETFISNPQNLPQVNHKDEDKTNNNVENLEWCDRKYNCRYGTRNERVGEKQSKTVFMYDISNNLLAEFKSTVEASKKLGLTQATISYNCKKECIMRKHKNCYLSYTQK